MRVWIDLTNTAHVLVLRPLVERLEAAGHEVELTARPLSHTLELLDDWGHSYTALGRHGGAGRAGKALAAASRMPQLLRFARGERFDCALAHGSTDLPPRLPRAPHSEHDHVRLRVGHASALGQLPARQPRARPLAIPAERLARYGARPPKLVRYPGLKEEYYLADFEPDEAVLDQLGIERERPLAVVRTAPSYALYLGGSESRCSAACSSGSRPRGANGRARAKRRAAPAVEDLRLGAIVPRAAVDGRSLVAFADLLVSAGGTMNREAAVLGTPVWSIFEGKLGAVDEQLAREGRLRFLKIPASSPSSASRPGPYPSASGATLRSYPYRVPWLGLVTLALLAVGRERQDKDDTGHTSITPST